MPGKTSDHLENLKKMQEDRNAKVDKFSKLDSKSDIKLSFDAIEDIIEQIIFNDQMDFLSSKNENTYELELASDKSTGKALEEVSDDNAVDEYLEQMELTQEQIDLLQKEFDQILF